MKKESFRQLLIVLCLSILILILVAGVSVIFKIDMPTLTRDVTAIADIHPLAGILSNLGILLWCASASVCAFTAIALRKIEQRNIFWFLLTSSLLQIYILIDDFFLFHEFLGPQIGIPEKVIILALGMTTLSYLAAFKKIIKRTNFHLLLFALGFLSASVFADIVLSKYLSRLSGWEYFLEDGAKWLGITYWCSYYMQTSYLFLVRLFGAANPVAQTKTHTLSR